MPAGQPVVVNPLTPLKVTGSKVPLQVSPLPLKGITSGNPLLSDENKTTTAVAETPAFAATTDQYSDEEELQVAIRRDPEEEYFMLAVLANKMI